MVSALNLPSASSAGLAVLDPATTGHSLLPSANRPANRWRDIRNWRPASRFGALASDRRAGDIHVHSGRLRLETPRRPFRPRRGRGIRGAHHAREVIGVGQRPAFAAGHGLDLVGIAARLWARAMLATMPLSRSRWRLRPGAASPRRTATGCRGANPNACRPCPCSSDRRVSRRCRRRFLTLELGGRRSRGRARRSRTTANPGRRRSAAQRGGDALLEQGRLEGLEQAVGLSATGVRHRPAGSRRPGWPSLRSSGAPGCRHRRRRRG